MKVVVLFSGGQDSTTALFWAKREWPDATFHLLTLPYGQRHERAEIRAAEMIGERLWKRGVLRGRDVHAEPVIGPGVFGGGVYENGTDQHHSALIDPRQPLTSGDAKSLPSSFVPGRNLVLLSLAVAHAGVWGADKIVIGANAVDFAGYPDCRGDFLESMDRTASLALGRKPQERFPAESLIAAPLLELSKAQIVKLARELGPDCWEALALTWTCYDPHWLGTGFQPYQPCGKCSACVIRAKGFADAGEKDPAL